MALQLTATTDAAGYNFGGQSETLVTNYAVSVILNAVKNLFMQTGHYNADAYRFFTAFRMTGDII